MLVLSMILFANTVPRHNYFFVLKKQPKGNVIEVDQDIRIY